MKAAFGLVAAVFVSGCVLDETGGINPNTVYGANSVDEMVALGAVRLSQEELEANLPGARFVEPNEAWTWNINEDFTQQAYADNGDWADAPDGRWQIVNGQFCRENIDIELRCSDVYQIGSFYRFTETDGSLSVWTVTKG